MKVVYSAPPLGR